MLEHGLLLAARQAQARHECSAVSLAAEPVGASCSHSAMLDESRAAEKVPALSVSVADSELALEAA